MKKQARVVAEAAGETTTVGEAGNAVLIQAEIASSLTVRLISGLRKECFSYPQLSCCQAVLSIRCTPESEKTGSLSSPTFNAYVACKQRDAIGKMPIPRAACTSTCTTVCPTAMACLSMCTC